MEEVKESDAIEQFDRLRESGNLDEARKVLEHADRAGLDVSFE